MTPYAQVRRRLADRGRADSLVGAVALVVALASCQTTAAAHALAYLANEGGYWQVWTARLDGSEPRQITQSPYDKTKVTWFADGARVLANGSSGEVMVVEVANGREVPVPLSFKHGADATVSPDGTRIAFSAMNASSPDSNDIWVAYLDGTGARKLTQLPALQHEPVWAADGATLYFLSGPGGQSHDIYRVDISSQSLEQVTVAQLYHFDLAVANDGTLAFSSNRTGNYDLWLRDADGNDSVLVDTHELESQPAWAPGEAAVYYTRIAGGIPNLWRVPRAGGDSTQITHHEQGARGAALLRIKGEDETP